MHQTHDLHAHSTASDGVLSPTDVVRRARRQGVEVLALTDHDTTAGLAEAHAAARERGMRLVPGVEVSVTWRSGTVHIVGLMIDAQDARLQAGLAQLRRHREGRAEQIDRRLARAGIPNALAGARELAGTAAVTRTHFARHLLRAGHASNMREVFQRFLGRGKPGFVSGTWCTLDEAVGWIRGAGGHAVIAHPTRYKFTATRLRRLFDDFRECGGTAIEVVSGAQGHGEVLQLAEYAQRYEFLGSQGSDFHAPDTPWAELGRFRSLPPGCAPVWGDASWQRRLADVA